MVCIPAIANLLCYFFVQIVFGNCSCPASKTIPAQLALSIVRTFPFKIALPIAVILVYSPFISCSSACSGLLDITWLQFHPPWYHSPVCGQPVQGLGCPARQRALSGEVVNGLWDQGSKWGCHPEPHRQRCLILTSPQSQSRASACFLMESSCLSPGVTSHHHPSLEPCTVQILGFCT